ncbi:MAG: hypothetical protein Q7V01_02625, partial [Vicinamibacterales bacterium]|nr:hypothetical protein [Vicinamibacterales bacterium]
RPDLCDRLDPDAAQQAHHSHPRVRSERFLIETIDALERLMSSGGHTHLILAGDPGLTTQLRDRLPRRVVVRLVDVVPALASASLPSVIAAARSRFIEREQQESHDAVAQLVSNLRHGGPAAAGTGPTLKALRRGEADVLVMAKAYPSSRGWSCWACGFVAEGPVRPVSCPECESVTVRPVNLKEEIVRLAERLSAEVEFISHSKVLMDLGGVGCLLRAGT